MDMDNLSAAQEQQYEQLVAEVERYEESEFPIEPPNPVEAIIFRMEQNGLRQKDLIPFIGSKSKVSEVLNGKRSLSKEMMIKLHESLGIPLDSLMGLGNSGILQEQKTGAAMMLDGSRFPFSEMVKKGWISAPETKNLTPDDIRNIIQNTFGNIASSSMQPVMPKRTSTLKRVPDNYALKAWQLMVLKKAAEETLKATFDANWITHEFRAELAKLSYLDQGPLLAKEFLNKSGIHLIILEHLNKTYFSLVKLWK